MEEKMEVVVVTLFTFLFSFVRCAVFDGVIIVNVNEGECYEEICGVEFNPYGPLIKCEYLSEEFIDCNNPVDMMMMNISSEDGTYGCQFGQDKPNKSEIDTVLVNCTVLPGIECHGDRVFQKRVPCIKYDGHHFVTILLFSVFLGFIGLDRFCLGHIPTAVGKLVTVGGLGVWWIIDVILLVTGQLQPKDGGSWCP